MALITCVDCGKKLSDLAPACPDCGRPNKPINLDLPQVTESSVPEQKVLKANKGISPTAWLLVVLSGLGMFIAIATSTKRTTSNSSGSGGVALEFQASCGSAPESATDGWWWPVLGPNDPGLLNKVKMKYCGDALINSEGSLQIASFTSSEEASQFAERLANATGGSFRVGEQYQVRREVTLNQLSDALGNLKILCDISTPACLKELENHTISANEAAGYAMEGKNIEPLTLVIKTISESTKRKGTWDIRGSVAWDQISSDNSVGMALGVASEVATMGQLGGKMYKEINQENGEAGTCLTTLMPGYNGDKAIDVEIFEAQVPELAQGLNETTKEIREGGILEVRGGTMVQFGKSNGYLKSTIKYSTVPYYFPTITIGIKSPDAVLSRGKDPIEKCGFK